MSYLSVTLRRLLSKRELSFDSVAKLSGLSKSTVSDLLTDKRPATRLHLEKLMLAFEDPSDLIDLSVSHLNDELPESTKSQIIISPRETVLHEASQPYNPIARLDDEFEDAVDRIRLAVPKNNDLRIAVIGLANAAAPKAKNSIQRGIQTTKPERSPSLTPDEKN